MENQNELSEELQAFDDLADELDPEGLGCDESANPLFGFGYAGGGRRAAHLIRVQILDIVNPIQDPSLDHLSPMVRLEVTP